MSGVQRRGRHPRVSRPVPLERLSSLEAPRDEWTALALESRNVFATWEWMSTWWRHYSRGRPLLLFARRTSGGRLAALLPLYL
jgi:hypothetical protein